MQRIFRGVGLGLLMIAMGSAVQAQPFDLYTEYETLVSQENETLDEFVLRIAPLVRDRTRDTGWELCGVLAQGANGTHGIVLTSSQSSIGCVLRAQLVPDGMIASGLSLHSHPTAESKRLGITAMDRQLAAHTGHASASGGVMASQPKRRRDGFSTQDMQTGPGYLVLSKEVLFQQGFGTAKRVGRI